jgi:perosamine synthetase
MFKPYVSYKSIYYVIRTLLGTQLAQGPMVERFEDAFAKKFNKKNVVSVNSGTSALELAYELAGIKEGDEVIVPVLTCTATNLPLVRKGAKLVFADIDYDLNINIEDVKNKITKKTKAIVFVHFGGNNRGLRQLMVLARRHGITVIEDAAQAVGSDYWGQADYTAVSLQAIKLLTSGDGGILLTRKKSDCEKAKRLRWFGIDRPRKQKEGDVDVKEAGYKYHMNDICASIGLGNLENIDKVITHQKKLMEIYKSYGLEANIWLAGNLTRNYLEFKDIMKRNGVEIGQHHYRNDKYSVFKKFKTKCPVMDELEDKYFFVPLHYGVSEKQANIIGKLYNQYCL